MDGTLNRFFRIPTLLHNMLHCSLRLPGLIILELMIRYHMRGEKDELGKNFTKWHDELNSWMQYFELSRFVKSRNFDAVLEHVLIGSILTVSVTFLLLPIQKLISMYLHVISILLLGAGYYLSYRYVHFEMSKRDEVSLDDFVKLERHGFHFLSQVMLATLVSCLLSIRSGPARCTLTLGALPIVARLCGFPVEKLHVVHNFACCSLMLIVCFYILNVVPSILSLLRRAHTHLTDQLVVEEDPWKVVGVIWRWLNLPPLFAMFFSVLCLTEVYVHYQKSQNVVEESPHNLRDQILVILSSCCSSPLSLLGFCCLTFYVSYFALLFTKIYLKHYPHFDSQHFFDPNCLDPDVSRACYIESIALLVLSLETGLINRSIEQKAVLICILLFIVFSSLLQSIYDIYEPTSMEISATPYSDFGKHVRTLSITIVLLILPLCMSVYIATLLVVDIWLMIIISSCVLITVQTAGSLVNYFLFMYDAYFKKTKTWDKLDDLVFYNRAVVRVLEFLVAFSVIITFAVRESLYGHWSWSNLLILIMHCYVNVWGRLQTGWQTFLLRRDAAKRLDTFPEASDQQLKDLQDVCSICYQNLAEAKVTPCKHFFHSSCLKKWFYVQLNCPMCHFDLAVNDNQRSNNGVGDLIPANQNNFDTEGDFTESASEFSSEHDNDSVLGESVE